MSALNAQAVGPRAITLTFIAVGTDHANPPAARNYVIKQSTRPIASQRDFRAAHALCHGSCVFNVTKVGTTIHQNVTGLDPHRTYYYGVVARDNVSGRPGPRSETISVRTR